MHASAAWAQSPPPVIAANAEVKPWSDPIEALGTLRADESVTLSATVTDTVTEINFRDGELVEAGQRLIQLNDTEERAQLRAARAHEDERRNALNRVTQLQARNLSARADVEDNQARLRQATAEAEALEARLANYRLQAPFSGRVGFRNISLGALVTPGMELVTLDKLDVMQLDFNLPEVHLGQLSPGLALTATSAAYPNDTFEGEVATVSTRVDPVSRSVTVRAEVDNPSFRLRPGMLMQVTLAPTPRETLVVPESAIMPEGQYHFVWYLDASDNHRVVWREVTLGSRREGEVEILSGLDHGDLVVAHGTERVREGQTPELLGVLDDDTSVSELIRQESR
ncbi:efflux RND transporter periplasmic adaptor subunit [Halomonas vilamensis]|uniref:Efflux RND transporter periplasmic adaptor subunit n=2 Tax=Vreelandella vilamensis TaxID=531309 RepID=A0ABU1H2V2_9GAMM|nr:efflux RND transporter periplasmic adaptor subunit [Halomonas vilamensis]MDR5898625.1 efflux RND transporter periplasmic adaptor subunit [Halomonas vilamensis]